jgi:hypothetical protein
LFYIDALIKMLFKYCMIIYKIKIFLKIIMTSLEKVMYVRDNINFNRIILVSLSFILFAAFSISINNSFFPKKNSVSKNHISKLSLKSINFNSESANDKTTFSSNSLFVLNQGSSNRSRINLSKKAPVYHVFERPHGYDIANQSNSSIPYSDDSQTIISSIQFIQSRISFNSRT